jgi:acyl carrier protein
MSELSNINEPVFDKIKSFVEELRWQYPFELKRETEIEQDLGITGDEAYEFIAAYSRHFFVFVLNFRFEDYFKQEGD